MLCVFHSDHLNENLKSQFSSDISNEQKFALYNTLTLTYKSTIIQLFIESLQLSLQNHSVVLYILVLLFF